MSENFIICGDDVYLRAKEEKKIRDRFLSKEETELNFSVFAHDEAVKALDELATTPFLADKRVVVIRDIDDLPAEIFPLLTAYLNGPVPTSVLVLTACSEFKKKPHYRDIAKKASEISAEKLTPYKIKAGIRTFFKKENIDISDDAADLILELKGSDPAGIMSELEKLAAYSNGEKIELATVEKMVGRSVVETVYKLVDAIDQKNAKRVFRILEDLAYQKKQAPEIIGYLAWYIRTVQKIKLLSSQGLGREAVIASSGKGAYKVFPEAAKYSEGRIGKWLKALVEADIDVKRGRKTPSLALEMLVLKLSNA
jgi:DNA polymerase III subunit delta